MVGGERRRSERDYHKYPQTLFLGQKNQDNGKLGRHIVEWKGVGSVFLLFVRN